MAEPVSRSDFLSLVLAPALFIAPVCGTPTELEKATCYKGWMAVKKHMVEPDPDSHRVGLNVRWFQAGLTRIDE